MAPLTSRKIWDLTFRLVNPGKAVKVVKIVKLPSRGGLFAINPKGEVLTTREDLFNRSLNPHTKEDLANALFRLELLSDEQRDVIIAECSEEIIRRQMADAAEEILHNAPLAGLDLTAAQKAHLEKARDAAR